MFTRGTAQNVGEITRHIRKKLAANTLDLLQVSQPTDSAFACRIYLWKATWYFLGPSYYCYQLTLYSGLELQVNIYIMVRKSWSWTLGLSEWKKHACTLIMKFSKVPVQEIKYIVIKQVSYLLSPCSDPTLKTESFLYYYQIILTQMNFLFCNQLHSLANAQWFKNKFNRNI